MTIRESYEDVQIKLNKKKAPALYIEDYLSWFKYAAQHKVNKLYAKYETSNQLSDDLQNLHRHVVVNLYSDLPFPLNVSFNNGQPFVEFYSNYSLPAIGPAVLSGALFENTIVTCPASSSLTAKSTFDINVSQNIQCVIDGDLISNTSFLHRIEPLNSTVEILVGTVIKIKTINGGAVSLKSYKSCGDFVTNNYSFDLNDHIELTVNDANPAYLVWTGSVYRLLEGSGFVHLNNKKILLNSPTNYWHLLGMKAILEVKNNINCDNPVEREAGMGKLTSEREVSIESNSYLEPSAKRPYYSIQNDINSVFPNFEIHYKKQKEIELVKLIKVEILYLKETEIYTCTEEELDGADETAQLEFQEYICQELVEEVTALVLEYGSDPRAQSFTIMNESSDQSRNPIQNKK